jgi:sodium/proline symporter
LLASSLGPLLVVRVLNQPVSTIWAAAMMIGGAVSALVWRFGFEFQDAVFSGLPGMIGGFLIFGLSKRCRTEEDPGPR